jgi:hypothetical protein
MIQSVLRMLAPLYLIAMLGPVSAVAQPTMRFAIPFDFNLAGKAFAAGNYEVWEVSHGNLAIRSEDGHAHMIVLTNRDEPGKLPGRATLTFTRYGDQYFLLRVANIERGLRVPLSSAERELMAGRASPRSIAVVAGK